MAKTKLTGRKRDERITAYAFTIPDLNIRL